MRFAEWFDLCYDFVIMMFFFDLLIDNFFNINVIFFCFIIVWLDV
jgi:hypothetical protein